MGLEPEKSYSREVFGFLGIYSRMFLPRIFKKASTILLFGLLKPASRPPGGVFFSFRMLGSRNRPSFFHCKRRAGASQNMSPQKSVCYCYYIWVVRKKAWENAEGEHLKVHHPSRTNMKHEHLQRKLFCNA